MNAFILLANVFISLENVTFDPIKVYVSSVKEGKGKNSQL